MSRSGSSVFPRQHRKAYVSSVGFYPVVTNAGLAITRRDTLRVLQHSLDITDRQARAALSSYTWEGWPLSYRGLNEPFAMVNLLEERVRVHRKRTHESRVENGWRGGRPPKPSWDVTPGSGHLTNVQPTETQVRTEAGRSRFWNLSGPRSDE